MKKLLAFLALASAVAFTPVYADDEGPGKGEMKEVCHDKTDAKGQVVMGKDGKPVQVCKKIKVRKKLEGTEIPPAKK